MEQENKLYPITVKSYSISSKGIKSPYFLRGGELLLWCKDNLTGFYNNEPAKRQQLNKLVGRLSVNTDVGIKIVLSILPNGFVLNDGNRTYKVSDPYIDFKSKVSKQIVLSGQNLKELVPQSKVTINGVSRQRDTAFALGMYESGNVRNHLLGITSGGLSLIRNKRQTRTRNQATDIYQELNPITRELCLDNIPTFKGKDFKFMVDWYKQQGFSQKQARHEALGYINRRG